MKYIYKILLLMFFFVATVQAQEEKDKGSSKEKKASEDNTELSEEKVSTTSYSGTSELETFKTNILGSVLVDFKDKIAKKTTKPKVKKRTSVIKQNDVVLLEKYTFLDNEELNPEFMINWCISVHNLSEKSYTYAEKYKSFCKTIKRKDLEKLSENHVEWGQTEWENDAIQNLNERLNVRDREIMQVLQEIKAKKKAKRDKKKAKKNSKKEKKRKKEEKKRKKEEKKRNKTKKKKKNEEDDFKKELKEPASTPGPDKDMVKLINEEVLEGKLVLKVSEPIFTKNNKKAIVLVTETGKNIVTIYVKVLKKSKGQRWCIVGEIQTERIPKDKSKVKKRKVIVKEFSDDGVNFVDGKRLNEISKVKTAEEKMIENNQSAKITRLSSVPGAYLELDGDERYDFCFKNISSEENEIVKFSFRGPKTSDFNDVFKVVKGGFVTAVTNETVKVKADDELIGMKYLSENGTRVVQFIKYNGDTTAISKGFSKKEINKLFREQGKVQNKETEDLNSGNDAKVDEPKDKDTKEGEKQEKEVEVKK